MTDKKNETLQALRETIRYHQALGIDEYPCNQEIRRFLEGGTRPAAHSEPDTGKIEPVIPASTGIDNLEQEINACTLCRLSGDTPGRVPGQGGKDCLLMVVGDWSLQPDTFSAGTLFGREEDVMLWKMMAAIGLQPEQVYATNCLKCSPGNTEKIEEQCEESCFSFLAREIAAVNPKIICAMGEMPVRVLMGRKEPLARVRGRFGRYRYQSAGNVVVMPTFHPRFLLQHPELKKAAWNDLLAIKSRLDIS